MKRDKKKYIRGRKDLGLDIDWTRILKIYNSLGVPKKYNNPLLNGLDKARIHVLTSERNIGKTTNLLLVGLILYWEYGIITPYLRATDKQIAMNRILELYNVILDCGYIDQITKGEYNSIKYQAKRWYLVHVNEDGTIDKEDNNPCCIMLAVNRSSDYKSTLNLPYSDWIIFDEFIDMDRYTPRDEFIWFMDLIKTLLRGRISSHIFLVANTIDLEHPYFDELGIYEEIHSLEYGKDMTVYSEIYGTPVYVKWIAKDTDDVEYISDVNEQTRLYFGFSNKKLNSIRGGNEWAVREYPQLKPLEVEESDLLLNNIYLEFNGRYLKLEYRYSDKYGAFIFVHRATKIYDDSIIYTNGIIKDTRYRYHTGSDRLSSRIFSLYGQNKFYYAQNGLGLILEKYMKR